MQANLKIGVDGIVLRGRDAGSLRYFGQLLTGLAEMDAGNDYVIFVNKNVLPSGDIPQSENILYHSVETPSFIPGALRQQLFRAWYHHGILDLLHCPAFVPPLLLDCKTVTTVFDLTFVLYPQTMKWIGRLWWGLLGRKGISRSDHIIAISQSTKRDLIRYFGIAEAKIHVVYPCTRVIFNPRVERHRINVQHGLPEKYILFVGTLERRKNVANLVRAFALAKRMRAFDHKLVLCGKRGWLYEDIFRTIEELHLENQVIFLGHVPDEDLPGLYSGAELFAYLSWFEGFGLPLLEAMACGVPVLTSNSSSMPEVVGDAGIQVPPEDVEQAATEMVRIMSDQDLRRSMIEKGLQRASEFSQERFIRETLAVYQEASQSMD